MTSTSAGGFRRRLRDRTRLAGSFIKTPSVHATEILGDLGFDFVIIDEEHGPFDRAAIDLLLLAARAGGIAGLVRVSGPGSILPALDMGAAGVVVPHVNSGAEARDAVAAARYAGGSRGFSPSPRAGRYGALGLADHVARADAAVSVTLMIEHPDALRNLEAIAAIQGVDALFLGLGDLAVAMGESSAEAPALRRAAAEICRTAQRHGRALMATAPDVEAGAWLLDLGVSALVVNSDQGFLRKAAAQQLHAFQSLPPQEVAP
ncbi:HpcH/HpaI aldolase family protein [Niveispirillum fermenti]|uniref:HpcH/HpaI aldolase family protein n=1 Tax=Niveispirillum fermenti TaxID=1233113 RepID=UPI003A8B7A38